MLPSYSSKQLRCILIPESKLSISFSNKSKPNLLFLQLFTLAPKLQFEEFFYFIDILIGKRKQYNIRQSDNTFIKTTQRPFYRVPKHCSFFTHKAYIHQDIP